MEKINIKNIILCLVLIIPLKISTHFFLFREVYRRPAVKLWGVDYPTGDKSFEYHFYQTFTDELWIFPAIIFTMIFILWYFDLYLIKNNIKKENPLNNNNKTKKQETVINQQIEKNENKSLNFRLDISKFPESTIKDINELDDEKKKQLLEATIFIDKDGFFDESKGQAKTIIKGLEFISKLKGIKDYEVVFDIATFLRMGDEFPPVSDKDGKWYVKFGNMIQKSFSDQKFKTGLKELLKVNNIDKKDAQISINSNNGSVIEIYEGDGFNIQFILGVYTGNSDDGQLLYEPPKNKNVSNVIQIINQKELQKQSLSYIHIEGKGLFNL